ncbi:MAG: hypothetical protein M0Z41_18175, partial [Peptococcaceae bacterium]|nr:hypothetical protein [Peptococcaceae bacterium]
QYLLVREIGRHAVEAFVCIHPALAEIQILNGQRLAKTLGYTNNNHRQDSREISAPVTTAQEAETLRVEVAFLGPEVCQLIFGQK